MIDMDDDSRKDLAEAIDRATSGERFMTEKSEIAEYYAGKYGETRWVPQFTTDMINALGLTNDKKTRNTIARDVQGARLDRAPKRQDVKDRYAALGKTLPPVKVPKDTRGKRARVKANGNIKISGDDRNKTIDRVLTPDQLQRLLEGDMTPVIEAYGNINPADVEGISNLQIDIELLD